MKAKTKLFFSVTACLFSTILIIGCNGQDDSGLTTIKFFGWGKTQEQRNFQTMVNAFMEDNPDVKVVYECVDATNYDTALQSRKRSLPDVFYMSDFSFFKWAKSGSLLDISKYVTEEDTEDIWPIIYNQYTYNHATKKVGDGGALYGLGKDLGPYTLVYNKTLIGKIFNEKGVTPHYPSASVPMTWDEFIEYLNELKYTDSLNNQKVWGIGSYEIMHAVYSNNADFFTEDTLTSRIGEKNFGDAIQFISNLTRSGVAPSYVEMKSSNAYTKFLNGQCLMTFMGPWDMAAFWEDTNFEFDIIPTPVGTADGAISTSWLGSCAISCRNFSPKESAKEEAAVRLAKYLCLGRRCAEINYKVGQAQPNVMSIAKNAWINNVGITDPKQQQPASKQVWVDVTQETESIKHRTRAKFYLYDGTCYDNLVKELNSAVIYEGKDNALEFCQSYNSTFQSGLDDNAAYLN
ncbi:MAG: ABC transporter substrate-binding protein [Bacilli bacterium]|jgi:multiple sugar transport system substrate-binding protein